MVETRGLTHIALGVRDPVKSFRFYQKVLGVKAIYRGEGFIQAQTPGSWDVLVFQKVARAEKPGASGGIAHFGFRLVREKDIELARRAVARAGGRVLRAGEFCPGEPYVFFSDPDGYEVEIWYELPTPADPKPASRRRARS